MRVVSRSLKIPPPFKCSLFTPHFYRTWRFCHRQTLQRAQLKDNWEEAPSVNHKERRQNASGNAIFSTHFHAIKHKKTLSIYGLHSADQKNCFVCEIRRLAFVFINFMRIQIALMIFQNWLFMFTHKVIKTHSIKESNEKNYETSVRLCGFWRALASKPFHIETQSNRLYMLERKYVLKLNSNHYELISKRFQFWKAYV